MENKKVLTSAIKQLLPYIILIAITFLTFRYFFYEKGISFFVDTAPYNLNMAGLKNLAGNLWVERYTGLGLYSSLPAYIQNFFAMDFIYSVINYFTKDIYINNTLWVFLPYPFFAISVYVFVKAFVKNNYLSLLSTLLFIFSYIYFMWFITSGSNILVWAVSGAMWFAYSFIKTLEVTTVTERLKYALIGALSSLLAISNIAYFYTFAIFLFLYYFMNFLLNNKKTNLKQFKKLFTWAVPIGLVNLFWLIPIFFMKTGESFSFGANNDTSLQVHSACATPVRNIMYMFCRVDPSSRLLYAYLFVTLFALISYYVISKKDRTNSILLLIFIFFYTLSLGTNTPLWKLYMYIPGSFLLRTPQRVFELMLLIFIILVGRIIFEYRSKILLLLMITLVCVSAQFYIQTGENGSNMKDTVPASYVKTVQFLQDNLGGNRVLLYPKMPILSMRTWSKNLRVTPPIIDFYLNERIVMSWLGDETLAPTLKPLFDHFYLQEADINTEKVIGYFGIKYILFQNDIREAYLQNPKEDFVSIIKNITNNKYVIDSEELKLYEVDPSYVQPVIYSSPSLIKTSATELFKKISSSPDRTAFSDTIQKDITYGTNTVSSTKVLPSEYNLLLEGEEKQTLIIFQERFHPSWRLYADKKEIKSTYINHLKVNGFENGWEINIDKYCQDYACEKTNDGKIKISLVLRFYPQKYLDCLLYLTYAIIALMSFYYLLLKGKVFYDIKNSK